MLIKSTDRGKAWTVSTPASTVNLDYSRKLDGIWMLKQINRFHLKDTQVTAILDKIPSLD
jgi:hypothetical protein